MTDRSQTHQLGGPAELMIFFRKGHFYPIQGVLGIPLTQQARDQAGLNPGTIRVEDVDGNALWRMQ